MPRKPGEREAGRELRSAAGQVTQGHLVGECRVAAPLGITLAAQRGAGLSSRGMDSDEFGDELQQCPGCGRELVVQLLRLWRGPAVVLVCPVCELAAAPLWRN